MNMNLPPLISQRNTQQPPLINPQNTKPNLLQNMKNLPIPQKKYVYTTPKYYEGQTIKSEYEKPESFKKHIPEGIDAPKPKPYYETEKPYVPLELTTPNVSYYLPNYNPVNPEIPVVHGIPNAPKPKYEVKEIPYERKTSLYTTYYTTTTTTTTTTYTTTTTTTTYTTTTTTTTTEKYPETQYHVEVKPEYKEVNYDK